MGYVKVLGGREVIADLQSVSRQVEAGVALATRAKGRELQRLVKLKAATGVHGPREPHIPGTGPGPNIVTGDYVSSIELEERELAGVAEVEVWTDRPQAMRLEHGFVGADSLGRVYHQRAYPHWGPAADEVEDAFFRQVEAIVAAAGIR
jgi:hypothetical protein